MSKSCLRTVISPFSFFLPLLRCWSVPKYLYFLPIHSALSVHRYRLQSFIFYFGNSIGLCTLNSVHALQMRNHSASSSASSLPPSPSQSPASVSATTHSFTPHSTHISTSSSKRMDSFTRLATLATIIVFSLFLLFALIVHYGNQLSGVRAERYRTIVQVMPHPGTLSLHNNGAQKQSMSTNLVANDADNLGAHDQPVTVVPPLPNDLYHFSGMYENNTIGRVDQELCSSMIEKPSFVSKLAGTGKWCRVENVGGTPFALWHGFWGGSAPAGFLSPPLDSTTGKITTCLAPYR